MKVSRIRAQLGLSKPTLSLRTHTTIHDFPNKPWRPPCPPLFWASSSFPPYIVFPSHTALWCNSLRTLPAQALLQIKIPRLIEQYSSNGFIHQWVYLCTHKHTSSLSAQTKRSCSPLFLRKLAENLLNPSLLPLLCCILAATPLKRASETKAIRTWAGPQRIRPFSTKANKTGYQKTPELLALQQWLVLTWHWIVSKSCKIFDLPEIKFQSSFWCQFEELSLESVPKLMRSIIYIFFL